MKILVLQGPPASGKSTWARGFVNEHLDWVIVSRDSIREGTGVYWVPSREKYISIIEYDSVKSAIECGLNVIIDATNLNHRIIEKWKELAEFLDCDIEFKKFDVSLDEALRRDRKRGEEGRRCVGENVVRDFFERYDLND